MAREKTRAHLPPRAYPLYALVVSGLVQIIAAAIALAAGNGMTAVTRMPIVAGLAALTVQTALAWLIARWLKLSRPWQILNLVIPPAVVAVAYVPIPQWVFLVIALAACAIYLPTFWTHVPFYPTGRETYDAVASLLPAGSFSFIDLGCGFGTLLAFLARRFPEGRFFGVEIGLAPYLLSKARWWILFRRRGAVRYRSMWKVNLGEYDVVYAFLAPGPMPALWEKVRAEMKHGSLFISNSFPAPADANSVVEIEDARRTRLYLYRM